MMTPIADQLVAAQARIVEQDYKHSLMATKWFLANKALAAAERSFESHGETIWKLTDKLDAANARIAELEVAVTEATRDD